MSAVQGWDRSLRAGLLLAYEWIALLLVRGGAVGEVGGVYLDLDGGRGDRLPAGLVAVCEELTGAGLLTGPDGGAGPDEVRVVGLTGAGQARYALLCRVHDRDRGAGHQ